MSQRGSAPRPASRRSPDISPEVAFSSPRSSQPSPRASTLTRDDLQAPTQGPGSVSNVVTDDGGRRPSSGARTSDVHGMLNTSESRRPYPRTAGFAAQAFEGESSRSAMGGPSHHGQGVSPYDPYALPSQQPPATSQPPYPPLPSLTLPGPPVSSSQRGSPTIGPPLPPLGGPRRILTPKSPRVLSMNRATRRADELQQNPLPQQPSLPGIASSHDISPRTGPADPRGPASRARPPSQGIGPPLPPPNLSPVAPRSLSQPIVGQALPPLQAADYLHSNRPLPGAGTGTSRLPSQPPLGRETPVSGGGGETRWSTGSYGSLAGLPWGRGLPGGESGQHMLTITPRFGEEIVVPVDTHQGSKTQDQKRQKNAIASARFRTRKKEREHQLEVDNHELALRARELEAERDFYRNERNRLRDIVSRTPEISQWANGPPSPVSTRGQGNLSLESAQIRGTSQGGSDQSSTSPARRRRGPQAPSPSRYGSSYMAETSGLMGIAPRPQDRPFAQPPPYVYGGPPPESSQAEPPARRRRIEHEPQFTMPSYGPPQTTLPPMGQAAYGLNPSRLPPASPGIPRLPPLRIDQPSPGSEHPPHPQVGPGPGGPPPPPPPLPQHSQHHPPYAPGNGRSYEPGWGQPPSGQQEGGPR